MVSPSYTLYTLYCVQKTTVYFNFYKQKTTASYAVAYYNPHIKEANIYFFKGQKRGKLSLQYVTICYILPFQIAI